jgi:glycosyltransferase involved in cell wall biosynthesis
MCSFGERVRYIKQANQGVGAARNTGVKASNGDLIAFLDADDYWHPKKLEKQVEKLESDPEIGLVHCGMLIVDANGSPLEENCAGKEGWVADEMLLFEPVIAGPGSCTLVKKEILLQVGGYDPDVSMNPSEDWELSYRIARRCKFGFVPEPLVFYRHHGKGAREDVSRMEKGTHLAWRKIFESDDPRILRLRRQSYGNLYKVLAGSYLHVGQYRDSFRNLLKSLWFKPSLLGYYLKVLTRYHQR